MSRVSDRVVLDIYRDGVELVAIVTGLATAARLMARSSSLLAFERESCELWWGPAWAFAADERKRSDPRWQAEFYEALDAEAASDEPPPVEPR